MSIAILNNALTGEMETTMVHTFIKAGKLKRWLARPDCPPVIKECKILFDKAYAPKVHDVVSGIDDDRDGVFMETSFTDDHPAPCIVPDELCHFTKKAKVVMRARLRHHGVIYAISSTHLGHSLILFYLHSDKSKSPIPGCIKFIFEQGWLVFAVQHQLEAAQGVLDPFEPYPHFSAKLYSSCLSEELEVVHVDWVLCHFVRWQISSEHVVVLSLSRVSCFGLPFHLTNLITGLIYCISTSSNSRQLNLYITFLLSSST